MHIHASYVHSCRWVHVLHVVWLRYGVSHFLRNTMKIGSTAYTAY
jgi:hypothetical protein